MCLVRKPFTARWRFVSLSNLKPRLAGAGKDDEEEDNPAKEARVRLFVESLEQLLAAIVCVVTASGQYQCQ